ncbi:SRPBCC domain-containing protein [Marinoscillum sp. MHG1-6]|uniref:SRPBCC family protein n=1 Tax=Marinoscillum sp. MHG1-6 TaxID=2959627 RepID=UPI0021586D8A|nr:SRPBCC domain-containing protein [Marinoscillum sp. MHG1-6]
MNTDHPIIIKRTFNAPRQLVWDVWTQPEHIIKWWGPEGITTRVEFMDFKPGGKWKYVMTGPDGTEYPVTGIFQEVNPIERYTSTDDFADEYKEHAHGMDLPNILLVTTLFSDLGERTEVTIIFTHPTEEDKEKHEKMGGASGWNSSFKKLDDYFIQLRN